MVSWFEVMDNDMLHVHVADVSIHKQSAGSSKLGGRAFEKTN